MKAIAAQKVFEQHGDLSKGELRQRQILIARAWLAGFRAYPARDAGELTGDLLSIWQIGWREAEKRGNGL